VEVDIAILSGHILAIAFLVVTVAIAGYSNIKKRRAVGGES
jgi:hypothetical protein